MKTSHYLILAAFAAAMMLFYRPADAATFPSIQDQPEYLAVGYNAFGDRILLQSNLCAGDAAEKDNMHVYRIVDAKGFMIGGGCWQMTNHHDGNVHYFSLAGGGWGTWPISAFHKPQWK